MDGAVPAKIRGRDKFTVEETDTIVGEHQP